MCCNVQQFTVTQSKKISYGIKYSGRILIKKSTRSQIDCKKQARCFDIEVRRSHKVIPVNRCVLFFLQFIGASEALSSTIQCFDAALGIEPREKDSKVMIFVSMYLPFVFVFLSI